MPCGRDMFATQTLGKKIHSGCKKIVQNELTEPKTCFGLARKRM